MSYYFSTKMPNTSYDEAISIVTGELKKEGFGVLTQIDVKDTLKKKIDVDFRKYIILGACNPHFAHQGLLVDPKLGALLPCNVVVEVLEDGQVEVSMIDPVAMVSPIKNEEIDKFALEIRERVKRIIEGTARRVS
ncbi:MAG: DUF302 domain-containing protein [Bacteroidales bacterium]|nr:DUF302 domain-containing protein [Bacteroidales bacterium]